jgi:hypothetical protein
MSGSGFGRASAFRSDRRRQIDHYIDFFGDEDRLVPGLSEARTAGLTQISDHGKHVATRLRDATVRNAAAVAALAEASRTMNPRGRTIQ